LVTGHGVASGVRAEFFGNILFGVFQLLSQYCNP
jgi:hypothetical protein